MTEAIRPRRRLLPWAMATAAVAAAVIVVVLLVAGVPRTDAVAAPTPTQTASASTPPATVVPTAIPVPAVDVASLAEARYDAVVPGLIDVDGSSPGAVQVFSTAADLPLFDAPGGTPVARLAAADFLGEPTPVVVVSRDRGWGLVLTPARRTLPSEATADQPAAAQSAGWAPLDGLTLVAAPTQHVVVSTTEQTVSIVDVDGTVTASFPAAIGTTETPTPTGVTGYLEQRYVDPSQGTGDQPIHLTSLHSTVADEPYGGSDGGLIGIHWSDDREGAISHGCIRVGDDAVAALAALPLGTLVVVE